MSEIKKGDRVNYHSVIGGPVTSSDHVVEKIGQMCGQDVAWISDKSGCVSLKALSLINHAANFAPGSLDR